MIPFLLWIGEFALETSGAIFAFRRRLNILFAYLAFSAATDAILFVIRNRHPAYGYGAWLQEAGQYLILCALACQIVSRMLEDYRRLTGLACGLCALLGVVVGFVWNRGETWESRFLDAEISASMFLGAMIVLGWIGKKKELEGTWNLISGGLVVLVSGNALCAAIAQRFAFAMSLYPIPALASLLLWNLAALRNQRKREFEVSCGIAEGREDQEIWPDRFGAKQIEAALPPSVNGSSGNQAPPAGITRKPPTSVWVEPSRWKVN